MKAKKRKLWCCSSAFTPHSATNHPLPLASKKSVHAEKASHTVITLRYLRVVEKAFFPLSFHIFIQMWPSEIAFFSLFPLFTHIHNNVSLSWLTHPQAWERKKSVIVCELEDIAVCWNGMRKMKSINECFLHLNHPPSVSAFSYPYQKLLNIRNEKEKKESELGFCINNSSSSSKGKIITYILHRKKGGSRKISIS